MCRFRGSCSLKPTLNLKRDIELRGSIFASESDPIQRKCYLIFRFVAHVILLLFFILAAISVDVTAGAPGVDNQYFTTYWLLLCFLYFDLVSWMGLCPQRLVNLVTYYASVCLLQYCASAGLIIFVNFWADTLVRQSANITGMLVNTVAFALILCEYGCSLVQFTYTWGSLTRVALDLVIGIITGIVEGDLGTADVVVFIIIHLAVGVAVTCVKNALNMRWFSRTSMGPEVLRTFLNSDADGDQVSNDRELSAIESVDHCVLAFGSCADQRQSRIPALRSMYRENPNLIIFAGDNIYADMAPPTCTKWCWMCRERPNFEHEYDVLLNHVDFNVEHRNTADAVHLATWDDHDYGENNAEYDYPLKKEAKAGFLYFLNKLNKSNEQLSTAMQAMKADTNRGIYYTYDYKQAFTGTDNDSNNNNNNNNNSNNQDNNSDAEMLYLKIYMLDARYDCKEESEIFGAAQLQWLENDLQQSINHGNNYNDVQKPDWYIFCCGSPVLNEGIDNKKTIPKQSRDALMTMIEEAGIINNTLLLTGDLHYSVWHKYQNLYEFTVSSFTHSKFFIDCDCCLKVKDIADYGRATEKSKVCKKDSFGVLKITKQNWYFCVKDAFGHSYLNVSNVVGAQV